MKNQAGRVDAPNAGAHVSRAGQCATAIPINIIGKGLGRATSKCATTR